MMSFIPAEDAMSDIEKATISLPEQMVAEIREAAAGAYAGTSEAIRDALRQWRAGADAPLPQAPVQRRRSRRPLE